MLEAGTAELEMRVPFVKQSRVTIFYKVVCDVKPKHFLVLSKSFYFCF